MTSRVGGAFRVHDSSRAPETAIAWALVGLFHALVVWVVSRPVLNEPSNAGSRLEVVFIQRPRAKLQLQPAAKREHAGISKEHRVASPTRSKRVLNGADRAAQQSNSTLIARDDVWDRPEATPADGITFVQNPLASTYNPRPRPAPGMFRMRRQLSPEDIVRGASQILGFWPPGYTDNPCGGLEKAVEMFAKGTTAREHRLLADAVEQQQRYCP